jgi:hypothetical protein
MGRHDDSISSAVSALAGLAERNEIAINREMKEA